MSVFSGAQVFKNFTATNMPPEFHCDIDDDDDECYNVVDDDYDDKIMMMMII